ncbi:hypothetical protein HY546_00110 [archaeon]|nr:hypothetical protein [archaeon]
MIKMGLRHIFGEKPIPVIIDFLRVHRFWDYPISEIANASGISYRTVQTVVPRLVKIGMLKQTRIVSNAKFYSINMDSLAVRKLDEFAIQADLEFGEQLKHKPHQKIEILARA